MIMNDNLTRDAKEKLCEFSKNNLNLTDVKELIGYVSKAVRCNSAL